MILAGISKTILIKLNGQTTFYTGNHFGGKKRASTVQIEYLVGEKN